MYFCPPFPKSDVQNFRDSKSLGKRDGKKWSYISKLLLITGVKLPRKKKFIFGRILQGSGAYTTGIRRLHNKDQEVYNKDQEAMFSDTIIEHSANFCL